MPNTTELLKAITEGLGGLLKAAATYRRREAAGQAALFGAPQGTPQERGLQQREKVIRGRHGTYTQTRWERPQEAPNPKPAAPQMQFVFDLAPKERAQAKLRVGDAVAWSHGGHRVVARVSAEPDYEGRMRVRVLSAEGRAERVGSDRVHFAHAVERAEPWEVREAEVAQKVTESR